MTDSDRPNATARATTTTTARPTEPERPQRDDQADDAAKASSSTQRERSDRSEQKGRSGRSDRDPESQKAPEHPESQPAPQVNIKISQSKLYGSAFGVSGSAAAAPIAVTGLKTRADIEAELLGYVRPASFCMAGEILRDSNLVILEGRGGLGKRTGAMALLHAMACGDVEQLPPTLTLGDLCAHEYRQGTGYLVADRARHERDAQTEFLLETLPTRLRQANAHLVMTTTVEEELSRSVSWTRPELPELLDRLLRRSSLPTPLPDEIISRIPDDWSMTDLVEFAKRMRARPNHVDEALDVFALTAIGEVRAWFDGQPRRRDIVEATALTFTCGANERHFESLIRQLDEHFTEYLPGWKTNGSSDRNDRPDQRRARRDSGLVRLDRIADGIANRRVLVFKSQRHRQQVLAELAERFEAPFWDAVQVWLMSLVDGADQTADEIVEMARGLALFAEIDFDETFSLFLEPLSRGDAGRAGLDCASTALRCMAMEDATAPVALHVAIRWIESGTIYQRIAAAEALIAELGVRYPAEAARRLWQLITQDHELARMTSVPPVMAALLDSLVKAGGTAVDVLALLEAKLTRYGRPGPDPRMVDLIMDTALFALSVCDGPTGRLAVFELTAKHPAQTDTIARLWVKVLCNRRYRARALSSLWDGLNACTNLDDQIPLIGDALSRAMPDGEQAAFMRDFRAIDARKRGQASTTQQPIAQLLIDAIERMHRNEP